MSEGELDLSDKSPVPKFNKRNKSLRFPRTEEFGRLEEIEKWMIDNDIPDEAIMVYAGCGSHSIEFEWVEYG